MSDTKAQTNPAKQSENPASDAGSDTVRESAFEASGRVPLQVYWENGVRFASDDDRFNLHVGGIGHQDLVFFNGSPDLFAKPGGASNGVGDAQASFLRRAILLAEGKIYDRYNFMIQYDFANASNENDSEQSPSFSNLTTSPAPLNIWLQVRDLSVLGTVRLGHQSKTIGMQSNTSSINLKFMERADNMDAFYGPFDNGYTMGITSINSNQAETMTWRYGIYQPVTNVFGVALNKYSIGARVTALPIHQEDGERWMHVGLGYFGGEIVQDSLRVRARPLLRNGPGFAVPVIADTGEVPANRQYTAGPEFAMVLGPVTVQAEYAVQIVTEAVAPSGQNLGTIFYQGGYLEALVFLTGERDVYLRREGVIGRVIPRNSFLSDEEGCGGGSGAWQVGIRYSRLDLNDQAIQGGQLQSWTVGINWYLNSNMKLQSNYLCEERNTPGVPVGWIQGFGFRVAFDF